MKYVAASIIITSCADINYCCQHKSQGSENKGLTKISRPKRDKLEGVDDTA